MIYIYALKDPRDGRIRYVGQTKNLQQRLALHLGSRNLRDPSNRRLSDWIVQLYNSGLRPQMETLETTTESLCQERERHWIRELASPELLNIDEGGTGLHSFNPSFLTKMRMRLAYESNPSRREHVLRLNASKRGIRVSESAKQAISKAHLGSRHSEATRRKISESLCKLRKNNPEVLAKRGKAISEAHKKSVRIADQIANLRAINIGRKLTAEHRRKLSESHKSSPKAQAQIRALNVSRRATRSGGEAALFG